MAKRKKNKKSFVRSVAAIILSLLIIGMLAGCSVKENSSSTDQTELDTNQQGESVDNSSQQSEKSENNAQQAKEEEPENPLETLQIEEHPLMNDGNTKQVGTWASVMTTKEFMSGVSDEQLYQYLNEISEKDYNWFNVFFEDGTGLDYGLAALIKYGPIDQEKGGSVTTEGRMFEYDFDSKSYQEQIKNIDEDALSEALVSAISQSYQDSSDFEASAYATGTTDNSVAVSIEIDQGNSSQEAAKELAVQFWKIAETAMTDNSCQLEMFDIFITNNGTGIGLFMTSDGKSFEVMTTDGRTTFEVS